MGVHAQWTAIRNKPHLRRASRRPLFRPRATARFPGKFVPATDLRGSAFFLGRDVCWHCAPGRTADKKLRGQLFILLCGRPRCVIRKNSPWRWLLEEERTEKRADRRARTETAGGISFPRAGREGDPTAIVLTAIQSSDRAVDEEPVLIRTSTRPSRLSCGSPKAPVCILEAGTPAASRAL